MSKIRNIYFITSSSVTLTWGNEAFCDLKSFCIFAICLKMPFNASMKINLGNVERGSGFSFEYF